jgi:alpha-beta hydrolase superfamily lysophospholipase
MMQCRIGQYIAGRCLKLLAILGLCLLAGCAPTIAPLGEEAVTPVLADDVLIARDGTRLPLRRWDANTPRAVIVALHGMSDYSNAFDMPARFWAAHGLTTLAFDQRGFGAGPSPGLWAGSRRMSEDLFDAVAAAHARYPGLPVFALGESMGGAVLLTALAGPERLRINGAILVAPAVWSRADMPLLYRGALFLAAHLLPGMILSNNAASRIVTIIPSDNVPMLRALARDPLFQKKTRSDAVYGLVNLMDEAREAPIHIRHSPPILLLYGRKDQIIPAKSTEAVVAALGNRAVVHRYDHGYHMLLRDLEGPMVWQDVLDWVAATMPAG